MMYDLRIRESVVKDYFELHLGYRSLGIKYNVPRETVRSWIDRAKASLSVEKVEVPSPDFINITKEIKDVNQIPIKSNFVEPKNITLNINGYSVKVDLENLKFIIEAMKND